MQTDSFSKSKYSDQSRQRMNESRHLKVLIFLILVGATQFLWISADAGPPPKSGKKLLGSKAARAKSAQPQEAIVPSVYLMRDPVVQGELQLNGAQQEAVAELAIAVNDPLWRMRDLAPEAGIGSEDVKAFNAVFEPKLEKILTSAQRERMAQIVLQLQGWAALARDKVAERLDLAADQRQAVQEQVSAFQAGLKDIRLQASAGKNPPELNRKVETLRTDLQRNLSAILTPAQRKRWDTLRGQPFDLAKLQPMSALAPELRDVNAWINSQPLTLAQLRGKVVALHFWTFG
jgi:hypothetical protein